MKKYIALLLHKKPQISLPFSLRLPEGCCGLMFVFISKKAARAWCGNKVKLQEVCAEIDGSPVHVESKPEIPNKLTAKVLRPVSTNY